MTNELIEIPEPWGSFFEYLIDNANLKNYSTFSDESKRKLAERMTIGICKAFSPKKNYGISKADIREYALLELQHIADNYDFYYK